MENGTDAVAATKNKGTDHVRNSHISLLKLNALQPDLIDIYILSVVVDYPEPYADIAVSECGQVNGFPSPGRLKRNKCSRDKSGFGG